ncbi:calcitonin gene-related peptide type 1 receptor-like [Mizuhopecten yessoensis]|uniref:calcitonin gene-related peptide type 1 receptor-like n=1 Tax=Mizuhopecten yessoensis TaxID=6573 RepID=UPI000B45D35B|nr:calcitonin gene-related peptide type 1 receptor-like [Mizuhopecten yessoensis]
MLGSKMDTMLFTNITELDILPTTDTTSGALPVRSLNPEEEMIRRIWMAWYECNITILSQLYPSDGGLYCNATFDGWDCWNYTSAGTRIYHDCPTFLRHKYGQPTGQAFKDCRVDGTWLTHPDTGRTWTNYTPCASNKETLQRVISIYYSGYALSIILSIASLLIFSCFRQLHCSRVTLHKHLFITYVLSGAAWILMFALMDMPGMVKDNQPWCQALHVLTQYLTLCNYFWMFCEGFYLHALVVFAFTSDKRLLVICYVIGWVGPLIPTAVYAAVRGSKPELRHGCWSITADENWILTGPVVVSLVVNFLFLLNILRILLSKLRAVNSSEAHQSRRTARATLILIPLLGLQYFVIPFQPDTPSPIYDIISAVLTSYQGVLVALFFCFCNGEVINVVRRKWKVMRERLGGVDMKRSNTFNVSLLETTYVPRTTSGNGSFHRKSVEGPLSVKGCDDMYRTDTGALPYTPVVRNDLDNGEV